MSVIEFCDRHDACEEGRKWALANCRDMDHAWDALKPEWLIWVATRRGVLDDRTLRLFAAWCARQVQHLMKDPRSVAALDVAERFANGAATADELIAAEDAARDAAEDAARAVEAAAWAAEAAAWAAEAAARAVEDAAWAAAWAARDESVKLQADWLRANVKPSWEAKR